MTKKRNRFTSAEKAKISLEAIKGSLTMSEIASKYSVHPTQISQWKKLVLSQLPEAFSANKKKDTVNQNVELSNLYEQIGRLKVENEFLKKKCDMFAD
jgi:transposase